MCRAACGVAPYPLSRILFVVAGGGADPFAVLVGHRGAVAFVDIQPWRFPAWQLQKLTSAVHRIRDQQRRWAYRPDFAFPSHLAETSL